MEELLQALSRTGAVHVRALSWAPLGLGMPHVHEVIPARRPAMAASSLRATLWKLWFDQWGCLRAQPAREPLLFHGLDGFLPRALRRSDRSVVTVHDLGWQVHPELYPAKLRLLYGALFPWTVRRADRFIAVSRYTAHDLMRRADVPASKIEVVYHGLDPIFSAGVSPSRSPGDGPYLLAVGGVSPRKNTRRLIEAFVRWRARGAHRTAYRLLITGTSLDQEFSERGTLPAGVTLLGYVDKAELPGLYAGASAFVYPGIYEGFGLPIIEAMACGAPVVTSNTGSAPEVAGGAAVIVDPFDVGSIEAGLDRATTPSEASPLRARGQERAAAFRWEAAARATIAVYQQVAG
jgi:glycosyltransferase involved in cell wall biosynthesis